jgi:hypothetical protein
MAKEGLQPFFTGPSIMTSSYTFIKRHFTPNPVSLPTENMNWSRKDFPGIFFKSADGAMLAYPPGSE